MVAIKTISSYLFHDINESSGSQEYHIKPTINPKTQLISYTVLTAARFGYINRHSRAVQKKIKSADIQLTNVIQDLQLCNRFTVIHYKVLAVAYKNF